MKPASRCLDDFALASRLSYFLWASMPDDELFRLAGQNRLHEPDQLKAQTLRLLNDPRADTLCDLCKPVARIEEAGTTDVQPDAAQFPGFDNRAAAGFVERDGTVLSFDHAVEPQYL